jgi:hypothetical protein
MINFEISPAEYRRWNRIGITNEGAVVRLYLPSRRFHRRIGEYAKHCFDIHGARVSRDEFERRAYKWLLTAQDREYVRFTWLEVECSAVTMPLPDRNRLPASPLRELKQGRVCRQCLRALEAAVHRAERRRLQDSFHRP